MIGDSLKVLDSLFEFAYWGQYPYSTEDNPNHEFPTELLEIIDHHIQVLVVAHKYGAPGLQAYALEKLDRLLQKEDYDPQFWNAEAFAHVVEQVYHHHAALGLDNKKLETQDQNENLAIPKRPPIDALQRTADEVSNIPTAGEEHFHWDGGDWHDELNPWGPPIQYLKRRIIRFALDKWARCDAEDSMEHASRLEAIAIQVPEFASDLAVAALKEKMRVHGIGVPRSNLVEDLAGRAS